MLPRSQGEFDALQQPFEPIVLEIALPRLREIIGGVLFALVIIFLAGAVG